MRRALNPYTVLGVERDADAATIKSAFRNAIKAWHPDVNGDPEAAARSREIIAAYEVLSDPENRFDSFDSIFGDTVLDDLFSQLHAGAALLSVRRRVRVVVRDAPSHASRRRLLLERLPAACLSRAQATRKGLTRNAFFRPERAIRAHAVLSRCCPRRQEIAICRGVRVQPGPPVPRPLRFPLRVWRPWDAARSKPS
jgi:curved DNA-binding protein CbpA